MRVAFLEDDEIIRSNYTDLLESEGYEVHPLTSYQEAQEKILDLGADLALLDIALSDDPEGGIKVCKLLRNADIQIPVIFLTSHTELDRQSRSWRAGADDYVTKDTNIELVLLRIRVLLERYRAISGEARHSKVQESGICIDQKGLVASWKGRRLDLNLTQFWILYAMVSHSGRIVSQQQLQDAASIVVEPNTIAAYIRSIRQAFTLVDPGSNPIVTERSRGYRWVGAEDE